MSQIEVGFGAVVQHKNFAVLVGAHGARVNVDVGVQFLHGDVKAAFFEGASQRGGGDALANRTDNAARKKDVLCGHFSSQFLFMTLLQKLVKHKGLEGTQRKTFSSLNLRVLCALCG